MPSFHKEKQMMPMQRAVSLSPPKYSELDCHQFGKKKTTFSQELLKSVWKTS